LLDLTTAEILREVYTERSEWAQNDSTKGFFSILREAATRATHAFPWRLKAGDRHQI